MDLVYPIPRTMANIKAEIHLTFRSLWAKRWKQHTHCRQTKLMIPEPTSTYSRYLLLQSRQVLSTIVHFLPGHNYLKYHMFNTGRATNSLCRLCGSSVETSWHLLENCEPLMLSRLQILFTQLVERAPQPRYLHNFIEHTQVFSLLAATDKISD